MFGGGERGVGPGGGQLGGRWIRERDGDGRQREMGGRWRREMGGRWRTKRDVWEIEEMEE